MTTSPIVTKLSQVDGRFGYSIISATLLAEVVKSAFSALGLLILAWQQRAAHGGSVLRALDALCPRSARQFLLYGVPSAVYMLNNNLVFVILTYISATTFQIFACMKTIMTGVVMHASGMKRLSRAQMGAISLLACSIFIVTSTASRPSAPASSGGAAQPPRASGERAMLFGLLLTVLTTTFSTAGGVFNEKLLKDNSQHSIHWQNLQLYAWGILFNAAALVASGAASSSGGALRGYTALTWAVVLNNASIGLCISAVLKFLDNIARVYAHGFAMIATLVVEVALSTHAVEPKLIAAIWVISASSYVYSLDASRLPTESRAAQTGSPLADASDESDSSGELGDGELGARSIRDGSGPRQTARGPSVTVAARALL